MDVVTNTSPVSVTSVAFKILWKIPTCAGFDSPVRKICFCGIFLGIFLDVA